MRAGIACASSTASPSTGVDFDRDNYPQEPALEKDGVSFNKGCYLGQEAVFMLEKRGHVKKRLVQLVVDGPVAVGDAITSAEGAEIGKITSAIARPGSNLALGYVKYKYAVADTVLTTAKSPAKVTGLLAIKPESEVGTSGRLSSWHALHASRC